MGPDFFVQSFLVIRAICSLRSFPTAEKFLLHIILQCCSASKFEGLPAPLVTMAILYIIISSIESKTEFGTRSMGPNKRLYGCTFYAGGCFSFSSSKTSGERFSTTTLPFSLRYLNTTFIFPCRMSLAKILAVLSPSYLLSYFHPSLNLLALLHDQV